MPNRLPSRSEIPEQYTWDASSVFADESAFDATFAEVERALADVREFEGHLGDSPDSLADFLLLAQRLENTVSRLFVYSAMFTSVDSSDQDATARADRVQGLASRTGAALAFAEPEMIAFGIDRLQTWVGENPRLAGYGHHLDVLARRAAHVRSAEVEELLSAAAAPLQAPSAVHAALANAELRFAPARDRAGNEHEVGQSNAADLLSSPDRELRRTAYDSYADAHLAFRNTMAAALAGGVKRDVFRARARRYASSLEAALEPNHIPASVFRGVLEAFRENLPTWHRYWRVRRHALGLERLQAYDTRATLTSQPVEVDFGQAVEWVCEGMSALGEEYVARLRRGVLEERWVDVYPNRGKRLGAFSMGVPGTRPFIFMSFNGNLQSVSTLAHELGHSMHTLYAGESQPLVYSDYGLFVAEVASNFHQALVRDHLLRTNPDPAFQLGVIEEAMANFHRYFFIMPSLARFELEVHERVERGEALTADGMTELMADLIGEVYGDEVEFDRRRAGSTWAQFHSHLYSNFYVYQYATGIAGAHALARRVLDGDPEAPRRYLEFISCGSSKYPLDALRDAGVDMTSRQPVDAAFAVMASYVDRLEELVGITAGARG